nr:MAG TPA: hypothetical protein [Caudoviricetes sp.]
MYITGKKARSYVQRYHATPYRDLNTCYAKPSWNKVKAWSDCIEKCWRQGGKFVTVLSYNSHFFTAAWAYKHPDTGVLMLHVETHVNSYDMEM